MCDDKKADFGLQQHAALMEALKSREGEVLTLLGFLLPALTGFGVLVYYHGLKKEDPLSDKSFILGWMTMQVLLALGARCILALAYNFRYNLLQMHKIEYNLPECKGLVLDAWRCPAPASESACSDDPPGRKKEWLPEVFRPQHDFLWLLTLASGSAAPILLAPVAGRVADAMLAVAGLCAAGMCVAACSGLVYRLVRWDSQLRRGARIAIRITVVGAVSLLVWWSLAARVYSWQPFGLGILLFLWLWWEANDTARRLNRILAKESAFSSLCMKCEPFRRLPVFSFTRKGAAEPTGLLPRNPQAP